MKDMKPFVIESIAGIILLAIGFLTKIDYYSTLLFSMGFAFIISSITQMIRIGYWKNPKRQDVYEARKREAHINSVDERKQYLRMKAGHITYQIMTILLLFLSLILTLIRTEAWIIAMIFLLFIFQYVVGVIVYRVLEKRI